MVLLLALALQQSVLTDSRLDKKLDFDDSLKQITEFCDEASKGCGVKLEVAKEVRDLKVDVFVEGLPVRDTLDKVAKVLDCEWKPFRDGYRLEMDVPHINRERNFVTAEDAERLEDVKLQLWANQFVAQKMPAHNKIERDRPLFVDQQERRRIIGPFEDEVSEAEASKDLNRIEAGNKKVSALSKALMSYSLGRVLVQFDPQAMDQFWKGSPFIASSFSDSGYKLYRSDFDRSIRQSHVENGKDIEAKYLHCLIFRFDPIDIQLKANNLTYSYFESEPEKVNGIGISTGNFSQVVQYHPVSAAMKEMPFYKALKPWTDPVEMPTKFSQNVDLKTKEWDSPWSDLRRRLGDHLRWFHQATGIPIVAQADRSCVLQWSRLNHGYRTATDYIRNLQAASHGFFREDKGFLLARNFAYWTHRRHEAPELVWKKCEPSVTKNNGTLAEIVAIAGNLRRDQIQSSERGYPVSRINLFQTNSAYDSVRLYASLTPNQRAIANAREGLSNPDLSLEQQGQMSNAIYKLILESGSISFELVKKLLASGLTQEPTTGFRFLTNIEDNSHLFQFHNEVVDEGKIVQSSGYEPMNGQQVTFTFGLNSQETVSQSVMVTK